MILALLTFLFFLVLLGCLIGLIFRRFRRKAAIGAVATVVALIVCVALGVRQQDEDARSQGFLSAADQRGAKEAGIGDAAIWRSQQEKIKQAEADRIAQEKARVAQAEARKAELLRAPSDQVSFSRAVDRGREQFKSGENELQRGAARPARASAICSILSGQINGWIGTLASLSTNGDGDGVVSIKIANKLHLVTWNNSLSDIGSDTLIKSNASLYQSLLGMKVGSYVRVYGRLFSGGPDCYRESSLTLAGSLEDPTFVMRFTRIEPVVLP